jgi:bidirectional [NiFe] hydrogenase diaphorase subunit
MDLLELHEVAERERASQKPSRIRCCAAAGCVSSGSLAVKEAFYREPAQVNLRAALHWFTNG